MSASPIWIAMAIAVLAVVALLIFFIDPNQRASKLTPLAGLAWAAILAGLIFGDDQLAGYGLLAVGVVLALLDIYHRSTPRPKSQ
jgi:hypothetical protein